MSDASSTPTDARRRCALCGAEFSCGITNGAARCWCADLPPLLPVPAPGAGCYCPRCLAELIDAAARRTT